MCALQVAEFEKSSEFSERWRVKVRELLAESEWKRRKMQKRVRGWVEGWVGEWISGLDIIAYLISRLRSLVWLYRNWIHRYCHHKSKGY